MQDSSITSPEDFFAPNTKKTDNNEQHNADAGQNGWEEDDILDEIDMDTEIDRHSPPSLDEKAPGDEALFKHPSQHTFVATENQFQDDESSDWENINKESIPQMKNETINQLDNNVNSENSIAPNKVQEQDNEVENGVIENMACDNQLSDVKSEVPAGVTQPMDTATSSPLDASADVSRFGVCDNQTGNVPSAFDAPPTSPVEEASSNMFGAPPTDNVPSAFDAPPTDNVPSAFDAPPTTPVEEASSNMFGAPPTDNVPSAFDAPPTTPVEEASSNMFGAPPTDSVSSAFNVPPTTALESNQGVVLHPGVHVPESIPEMSQNIIQDQKEDVIDPSVDIATQGMARLEADVLENNLDTISHEHIPGAPTFNGEMLQEEANHYPLESLETQQEFNDENAVIADDLANDVLGDELVIDDIIPESKEGEKTPTLSDDVFGTVESAPGATDLFSSANTKPQAIIGDQNNQQTTTPPNVDTAIAPVIDNNEKNGKKTPVFQSDELFGASDNTVFGSSPIHQGQQHIPTEKTVSATIPEFEFQEDAGHDNDGFRNRARTNSVASEIFNAPVSSAPVLNEFQSGETNVRNEEWLDNSIASPFPANVEQPVVEASPPMDPHMAHAYADNTSVQHTQMEQPNGGVGYQQQPQYSNVPPAMDPAYAQPNPDAYQQQVAMGYPAQPQHGYVQSIDQTQQLGYAVQQNNSNEFGIPLVANEDDFGLNQPISEQVPLERSNAGRPPHALISWGFGGKFVTMFPKPKLKLSGGEMRSRHNSVSSDSSLYDNVSGKQLLRKGAVKVFKCKDLIQQNDKSTESMVRFPGPLSNQQNSDLEQFFSWICSRQRAIGEPNNVEDGEVNGSTKLLWKALQLLVASRGQIQDSPRTSSGTPEGSFESKLIQLLRNDQGGIEFANENMESPVKQIASTNGEGIQSAARPNITDEEISQAIVEIERLILLGDREGAVVKAVECELWAQALAIANFVSASAYRKVVARYAQSTFKSESVSRTLLMLIAGQGTAALENEEAEKSGSLSQSWKKTLMVTLANRTPGDCSVLQVLGDRLQKETKSTAAAHLCYIVAGVPVQASVASRIVLIGGDHKHSTTQKRCVTPAAIQRTELYIHSKQLNNALYTSTSFQPYRLIYAMWLADIGLVEESYKWVESITECVKAFGGTSVSSRRSAAGGGGGPFSNAFKKQLKIFKDRIQVSLGTEKEMKNSWFSSKSFFSLIPTPSLRNKEPSTKQKEPEPVSFLPTADMDTTVPSNPSIEEQSLNTPRLNNDSVPPMMEVPPIDTTLEPPTLPPSETVGEASTKDTPESQPPIEPTDDIPPPLPPKRSENESESTNQDNEKPTEKPTTPTSSYRSGFLSKLKETIVTAIVPKPKDSKEAKGMGSSLEARYDPDLKKWIFPGEEDKEDSAPSAPPTFSDLPASEQPQSLLPGNAPPSTPTQSAPAVGGPPPSMYSAGKSVVKGGATSRYVAFNPFNNDEDAQNSAPKQNLKPAIPPPMAPPKIGTGFTMFTPTTPKEDFTKGSTTEKDATMKNEETVASTE